LSESQQQPGPEQPATPEEPLFALYEYAIAETRFIGGAVDALARTRDGLYGQIQREPVSRVQTTQITTDEGVVVEQPSVPVKYHITIHPEDLISGRLDRFIASLDEAADEMLGTLMPQFYEFLSKISEATGNVVDASDRPFFDVLYEAIEKVEMEFDEDGNHNHVLVLHPDQWAALQAKGPLTPEQQQKLDDLFTRKREEADARRRHRRLS
jgi:hypothetical protein